ncbi:MAG: DUF378 domain-containing protein [Clostridia bacterium]|nr:DUF378 domain-containing protein [Clostridia bacterium]
MSFFDRLALILVIVGALNWGSVGIFDFNFVDAIFKAGSVLSRVIYTIVGVAGLWSISLLFRDRHNDHP